MASLRRQQTCVPNIMLEVSNQEKERELVKKIKSLGGTWTKTLEKNATHLICDHMRCSEKFLGACVRGLWVIKSKFIEDSYKVGNWLPEEIYEFSIMKATQQSAELISAAKRWRWTMCVFGEQPFSGWKVSILPSPDTVLYERLLVYGGAELVRLPLPVREQKSLPDVAYVFMDESYKSEAEVLQSFGVMPLQYEFIKDSVIKDEVIDPLNYLIGSERTCTWSLGAESTSFRTTGVGNVNSDLERHCGTQNIDIQDNLISYIDLTVDDPSESCDVRKTSEPTRTDGSVILSSSSENPTKLSARQDSRTKDSGRHISFSRKTPFSSSGKTDAHVKIEKERAVRKIDPNIPVTTQQNTWRDESVPLPKKRHLSQEGSDETQVPTPKKLTGDKVSLNPNLSKVARLLKENDGEKSDAKSKGGKSADFCERNLFSFIQSELENRTSGDATNSKMCNITQNKDTEVSSVGKNELQKHKHKSRTASGSQATSYSKRVKKAKSVRNSGQKTEKRKGPITALPTLPVNVHLYGLDMDTSPSATPASGSLSDNTRDNAAPCSKEPVSTLRSCDAHTIESACHSPSKKSADTVLLMDKDVKQKKVYAPDSSNSSLQTNKSSAPLWSPTAKMSLPPNIYLYGNESPDEHVPHSLHAESNPSPPSQTFTSEKVPELSCKGKDSCKGHGNVKGQKKLSKHSPALCKKRLSQMKSLSQGTPESAASKSKIQASLKKFGFSRSSSKGKTPEHKAKITAKRKIKFASKILTKRGLAKSGQCNPMCDSSTIEEPDNLANGEIQLSVNLMPKMSCDFQQSAPHDCPDDSSKEKDDCSIVRVSEVVSEVSFFSGWPLSYPLRIKARAYVDRPSLPALNGQLMEAAREMDFYDSAVRHGTPIEDKAPTVLLLSELLTLFMCKEPHVSSQAYNCLRSWLEYHPPVTATMNEIYIEVLQLKGKDSHLLDILENAFNDSPSQKSALLFEYVVSIFEVNFNYYLQNKDKSSKRIECLFVKWLWGNHFAIAWNRNVDRFIRFFESAVSASSPNFQLVAAISSLIGMVSECLRLASVKWTVYSPIIATNSTMDISHMMAKPLIALLRKDNHCVVKCVLDDLRPDWLRCIVVSIILKKTYNNHLLTEELVENQVSLYNIVTLYFFLVPPLTLCNQHEKELDREEPMQENIDRNSGNKFDSVLLKTGENSLQTKISEKKLTAKSINKKNHHGESALHIACKKDRADKLKELLSVPGVDVNMGDNFGWTPLHEACNHGSKECVELLLKFMPSTIYNDAAEQEEEYYKVNLNARAADDGKTPLHDAVKNNHVDIAMLLLKYGGRKLVEARTISGYTALQLAATEVMKAALISDCDQDRQLDLSLSQNSDTGSQESSSSTIFDMAPIPSLYRYEVLLSCGKVVKQRDISIFLSHLSVLVSSYYETMWSFRKSVHPTGVLHKKDQEVLANMRKYVKFLRRHVKKLTRTEDFDALQFELTHLEMICLTGGEN